MAWKQSASKIIDSSGDACIQDQHSPPIDNLFAEELDSFTLSADTIAATPVTLPNQFVATTGHGIIITDEIFLLDVLKNRSFYAIVIDVAGDAITIDRSLDLSYSAASTLGRIVNTNMAVDGSVTPRIFSARAGIIELDITRVIITMLSSSSMDDSRFGSLVALSNGLSFRLLNSFKKTIFNFKSNQEIKQFCYDVDYSDKAPSGQFGLSARITFAGQDKHGVTLRIGQDDYLQWIIQDNLEGLDALRIALMGHEVTD